MHNTQPRHNNGRYASTSHHARILRIFLLAVFAWIVYGAYLTFVKGADMVYIAPKLITVDRSDEMLARKINRLKDALVNDLAAKCETKGVKDPDGAIIFDSNNEASLGAWMFQRKTVKHYVSVFDGRAIENAEAIAIAIDHDKAFALAKKIIFEDKKGVENWHNCAVRLSLYERVDMIKQLETL